ncbi:TetR/AcrR family transcriptional regulator [Granulicella paludicola]|uniref:TetR/AcrR family transcriptional regulator n=1 Tax=Granulicella paludicola TaxID=474951 RepID=UPI0021DF50D8|nr:TetR/AcrR family transcriptional regulator [Granulicella paludicola]
MNEVFQSVEAPQVEPTEPCMRQDPRSRRTRELLQQALAKLMEEKDFDKISVNDITGAATVNRATFYAHYPDKFALLECLVAGQFHALLDERGVSFNGSCSSALRAFVLGVCDFLARSPGVDCEPGRPMEPHMESAVVAVVRGMLLEGMRNHIDPSSTASPELRSATISWAIFGAAKEWVRTQNRLSSDEIADIITSLVGPLMH